MKKGGADLKTRYQILNLRVDPVDMQLALSKVRYFLEKDDGPHSIFAVNPEKNFSIIKDPALYKAFNSADLLIPDGIGIVIALKLLYGVHVTRVPGVELMSNICNMSANNGYKIFVFGACESVNKSAVEKLKKRFPGINIVGRQHGYVKEKEMDGLIARINESAAQVLFLALGSPMQEKWYTEYKNRLKYVRVCQGIGGSLDVITGKVKRAPENWRNVGLEWLYRLLSEPCRIKRQRILPIFVAKIIFTGLKRSFIPLETRVSGVD